MKEVETIHQDELIKLVLKRLKSINTLFVPTSDFIKEQINECMSKDYIKFSENED